MTSFSNNITNPFIFKAITSNATHQSILLVDIVWSKWNVGLGNVYFIVAILTMN